MPSRSAARKRGRFPTLFSGERFEAENAVLVILKLQDKCCGADGDDGTIFETDTVLVAKDVVHVESARSGRCIAKDVLQTAVLASLHADDAMTGVNAGIDGLDGFVDVGAIDVTPEHIVAHVERNLLTKVESILDDDDRSDRTFSLRRVFLLFCRGGRGCLYGKLFAAIATNEDETLARFVARLVENCVAVALGATDFLHLAA